MRTAYERGTAFPSYNAVAVSDGTTTGDELALPVSSGSGYQSLNVFGWQVVVADGTYSALQVDLEASLDGENWGQLDTTSKVDGDIKGIGFVPVKYLRARVVSATVDADTPTVTVLICA